MKQILFYKSIEPYGYLNNFAYARMFVFEDWFDTVEHAYQCQKTLSHAEAGNFKALAQTPRQARDEGQKLTMRPDWDDIKIKVMKEAVMAKFLQHQNLLIKLLETEDAEIIEDSPIDSFWGRGPDYQGHNHLGKVLMEVRKELSVF